MDSLLNLRDLLQHEIDDLYSAEEQIIEALPKMVERASDRELKKALNDHLKVTREQKNRLDQVRKLLGSETASEEKKGFLDRIFGSNTKCKGTEGLIKEGEKMMGEDMDPAVMDAAIIASSQKIEHYEISGYGTARAYARELGLRQVEKLLTATLEEEYKADDDLTALALRKVNVEAEKGTARAVATTAKKAPARKKVVRRSAAKPVKKVAKKKAAKKKLARK